MSIPEIPGELIFPEPKDDRERELYRTLQDWSTAMRRAILAISEELTDLGGS